MLTIKYVSHCDIHMIVYFAISKLASNKLCNWAVIVDTLLKEEAVDKSASPHFVLIVCCKVYPKLFKHVDCVINFTLLMSREDVCVDCTKSDACHHMVPFTCEF